MPFRFNYYHNEDVGLVRDGQEDSHGAEFQTVNGDVLVLCDGMGGHVGGKLASEIAVKSILGYVGMHAFKDVPAGLEEALRYANVQILGYADEHPEMAGMGTTACVVLLQDNQIFLAHVGDSRIYLYLGKERELHRVTVDHSYVQALVNAGSISPEAADRHPDKNRILQALGSEQDISPSISVIQPKKGDKIILCSDGLSDMCMDDEIETILRKSRYPDLVVSELIGKALQNGGCDNVTVQLLDITESPFRRSRFTSCNPAEKVYGISPRTLLIICLLVVVVLVIAMGVLGSSLALGLDSAGTVLTGGESC